MNTALLLMGVVFCLALSQAKAARDVTIGSSATSGGSFTGGTFTPTADNATVSAADVSTMLDAGVSVTITTGDTGAQAGSITMTAPVTQFGSFGSSLTLSAAGSITLNAISLGFAGGALTVSGFGAITQTGGLTISGNATFTTASGAIMLTQGNQLSGSVSLNTGANDVWLSNNRGLVLGPSTVGGSLTIDANGPVTQ